MRRVSSTFVLAGIVAALDQLIKGLVARSLLPGQSIPLIPGFLSLSRVHNTGSAFGILEGRNLILIFVVIAVSAYLVWVVLRGHLPGILGQLGLGLILGGAIGNLADRVVRGYVIDYIDFRFFPAFNLADSCVVIGTVLMGLSILRSR